MDTMNINIRPGFRASTAPLVCLLYNMGHTYLLRCAASVEGNYARRQTLKTRLARRASMRPAATRSTWRHERVELERVVDCGGGGFERTPRTPPGYGHGLSSIPEDLPEHLL